MPASGNGPLTNFEFEFFHRQVMLLLDTGQSLPGGIRRVAREFRKPAFQRALNRMALGLAEGENLSDAMAGEKGLFPPEYIALVRIGEKGGDLGETLEIAIKHERLQNDFKTRVQNVLIYPCWAFAFACALYIVMSIIFFPPLLESWEYAEIAAPGPARWSMALFHWGKACAPYLAIVLALGLLLWRKTNARLWLHGLSLRIPFLKRILIGRFIALFSENTGALLRAGSPLDESLALMAGLTKNRRLSRDLKKAAAAAREGEELGGVLSSMAVFPDLFLASVDVGARGGSLPAILAKQANIYRTETEFHSRAFLRVLDAALLLIVGLWVAFLATGVFTMYIHSIETLDHILRW
ncbi:MAG: hypothetical protein GY859_04165 [Desulfobacterales bacterium]|nr:hypothetical protein [Desulfobacterales bacterium]